MIACAGGEGALQPLLPPDPLHPFVIDAPTLKPEPPVHKPPASAHVTPGQLTDAAAQLLLLKCGDHYRPALRIAALAGQPAVTALGHAESILQNADGSVAPQGALCSATSLRAQKLPSTDSLSIALSNSASARSLLRRAFSCSNSLRRFASVAFIPQ